MTADFLVLNLGVMARPRTDPALAARALVAALPALIEEAAAGGGPLALAVYAMRTALAEARRVVDAADGPAPSVPPNDPLRSLRC